MSETSCNLVSIGGEAELDPDLLWSFMPSPAPPRIPHAIFLESARSGIKLILDRLNCGADALFLLPAYLCKSVLQPFLENGVKTDFYQVDACLNVNLRDLKKLMKRNHVTGVLFINYFGFPPNAEVIRAMEELKEQCWVIEDCAHSPIGEPADVPIGRVGHFAITSYRKYLPLPDGGMLIDRTGRGFSSLPPARDGFVRKRAIAKFLRHEFLHGCRETKVLEETYLTLFGEAEREIDSRAPVSGMSRLSHLFHRDLDLSEVCSRRRSNFLTLQACFQEHSDLQRFGEPILKDLPANVCPLVFPVRVSSRSRDVLRRLLMKKRVFCPVHWPLPREVDRDRFPAAYRLSSEILGLPVDQRYEEREMNSLLDRILSSMEEMT